MTVILLCPFETVGLSALNCYKYTILSGEVNTFIVKSLQTVCQAPGGVVVVVSSQAHISIIAD
jgi:hypothetical protein